MGRTGDNGMLLARVNFPLYTIKVLTERHILVAGGGGPAKTGITNTVEIYELINQRKSCRANRVTHYDTGSRSLMNSVVFKPKDSASSHIMAAGGMDGLCLLYQVKMILNGLNSNSVSRERNPSGDDGLRRRRTSSTSSTKGKENDTGQMNGGTSYAGRKKQRVNGDEPDIKFEIAMVMSLQTDFNSKNGVEPFQKVIRFSPKDDFLITGGADGHIRVWKYPPMNQVKVIKAHDDEIDDMDVDPDGSKVCSVSRDGHGYIWSISQGKKLVELKYELPINKKNKAKAVKYDFRGCRYGLVGDNNSASKLFTMMNPTQRQKPPNPSYLCKWDTIKYVMERCVDTGPVVLSTMAVSDDGRYIGVGTLSGSIDIYIGFSLKRIYHMQRAHSFFVTGVEFLKTCDETQRLTGDHDASLVSISVDNHIVVHHVPKQVTLGFFGSTLMFIMTMFLVYLLMDLFGL